MNKYQEEKHCQEQLSDTLKESIDNQTSEQKQYQDASNILGVTTSLSATVHPKILLYFKKLFKSERSILQHAVEKRYSSKSIVLTVIAKHDKLVKCEYDVSKIGPSHHPIFTAEIVLQSKKYVNAMIKLDASGLRKGDAQNEVFFKLANLLYQ
ncbi:hypothetical protein BD770DRAFT_413315 [Pilaira anomala]|nr:hypothetical protein BD770DRAFT_413315 [Pilaira anomala]